jgi:hypothetical protein
VTTLVALLTSASGTVSLSLDEQGVGEWCQVHLLVSGARRPLGAERLSYIAAHLATFLTDTSPGRRWVFSLAELHTSAYGAHVAGEATIQLQDSGAKMFASLTLTLAEQAAWVQALSRYR